MQITERDRKIFHMLDDLRFLTVTQLAHLFFSSRPVADQRLRLLGRAGYLTTLDWTRGKDSSKSVVYALARAGAEVLREDGRGSLPRFIRPSERRSRAFIEHTVLRNELFVVLELLTRETNLQLVSFRHHPEEVAVSATLHKGGGSERRVAVADAFFAVLIADQCSAFLVEIDRATLPLKRMKERYEVYEAWWRKGGARQRFGGAPLRILTFSTKAHVRSLAAVAPKSSLFWFTTLDTLQLDHPEALLAAYWLTASGMTSSLFT